MKVLTNRKDFPKKDGRLQAEFLAEVSNIVAGSLDRDTVLRRCVEELQQIVQYDSATVAIFSKGIQWELAVGLGYKDETFTNLVSSKVLIKSPILKQMARDLQPVISKDVNHLPGWIWIPGAEHVRSFMAAPMVSSERMIGVLMVDNSEVDFYHGEDLALVQTLANTLAVVRRTEKFHASPMSTGEAIMQLNLEHKQFLVFRCERSGGVNVVYRREDGTYGLIETPPPGN